MKISCIKHHSIPNLCLRRFPLHLYREEVETVQNKWKRHFKIIQRKGQTIINIQYNITLLMLFFIIQIMLKNPYLIVTLSIKIIRKYQAKDIKAKIKKLVIHQSVNSNFTTNSFHLNFPKIWMDSFSQYIYQILCEHHLLRILTKVNNMI